jgi:hypothetical protein
MREKLRNKRPLQKVKWPTVGSPERENRIIENTLSNHKREFLRESLKGSKS